MTPEQYLASLTAPSEGDESVLFPFVGLTPLRDGRCRVTSRVTGASIIVDTAELGEAEMAAYGRYVERLARFRATHR